MKKISFISIMLLCVSGVLFASDNISQIKVLTDSISISSAKNIGLNPGADGAAYYKNRELATKNDIQRTATIVIAAYNASEKSKSGADYICTGINDYLVMKTAIESLPPGGGKIQLTEGEFKQGYPLSIERENVSIVGVGRATVINVQSNSYFYLTKSSIEIGYMHFNGGGGENLSITTPWITGSPVLQNMFIHDLSIEGCHFAGRSLEVVYFENSMFSNIHFLDCNGLDVGSSRYCNVNNIFGVSGKNVVRLRGDAVVNPHSVFVSGVSGGIINITGAVKNAIITNSIVEKIIAGSTSRNCIISNNFSSDGITNSGISNYIYNNY